MADQLASVLTATQFCLEVELRPRFSHCQRVSLKAFNPWDQNLLIQKIKNSQGSEGGVEHLVNFYHC